MHFQSKLLGILFILFSVNSLKSQNLIVYDNIQSESYLVKYINNPTASQSVTNYYIQEISKSIPKMLNYTQYVYSYKQHSRIIKLGNIKYNIQVDLDDVNCTGDIYFRGFSMIDILLPSLINFDLKIFSDNNQLINNYAFKEVPLNNINSRIADFEFIDTTANMTTPNKNFYLLLENKTFDYPANAINNFNKKRKLIDEYYMTDQFIANSLSTIQTIDLQNLELINLYDIKIDEIEQELSKIYNKEFSQKLKLNINDPIQFTTKIESLSQQVYGLRFNINQILASLDKMYYEKALNLLKSGAIDQAIYNFNKSIEINYYYCPAHYQLALIDYNTGKFDDAASRIKLILTKMYPDYNTQILVKELTQTLNDAYLYEGNKLIKSEDYNEALDYLERGKAFCSSTPGISCNEQLFTSIAVAKYGIFSSYLSVADKAVENDKLELSEAYINLAAKYQKENKSDIINTGDIDIVLNKLIAKYIDNGFSSNNLKNYTQALAYFNKAIELQNLQQTNISLPRLNEGISIAKNGIYQEYLANASELFTKEDYNNAENITKQAISFQKNNSKEVIGANDAEVLLSKIKYQQYMRLIGEGKAFLSNSSYDNALNKFENARQLEENYNFLRASNLDSLIKASAKPLIYKDFENANFDVFKGDLQAAKDILTIIVSKQQKYNLNFDNQINTDLKNLREKIFTEDCKNAQKEYDQDYNKAKQKIAEKNYMEAGDFLEEAINIALKNNTCGISSNSADSLKFNILPAISYQNLYKNMEEAFKNNNFGLVIDRYIETEKYFNQYQIDKFGLKISSLFDYAVSGNNVNFLTYLTDYYTTKNNCNEALSLLKELKTRNYPEKNAKLIQENLAKQMAENNHKINPQSNPKIMVLDYTNGDKWFKYFSKAYLKKWKSIK